MLRQKVCYNCISVSMLIPFEQMPEQSRVWIYAAHRTLTDEELQLLLRDLVDFLQTWQTHGKDIRTSYTVLYKRFIVLAVDEQHQSPSGCAIDQSVRFMQALSEKYSIQWMNRGEVFFFIDNHFVPVSVQHLRSALNSGQWNADTLVFDTSATTPQALERGLVPARQTWLARYLQRVYV